MDRHSFNFPAPIPSPLAKAKSGKLCFSLRASSLGPALWRRHEKGERPRELAHRLTLHGICCLVPKSPYLLLGDQCFVCYGKNEFPKVTPCAALCFPCRSKAWGRVSFEENRHGKFLKRNVTTKKRNN